MQLLLVSCWKLAFNHATCS